MLHRTIFPDHRGMPWFARQKLQVLAIVLIAGIQAIIWWRFFAFERTSTSADFLSYYANQQIDVEPSSIIHWSCDKLSLSGTSAGSLEDEIFDDSVRVLCENEDARELLEVRVDGKFAANYRRYFDERGWVDEAYVTFVGAKSMGQDHIRMVQALIRSVELLSSRPVIVFCVESERPCRMFSSRNPHLIVMHVKQSYLTRTMAFDFHKWRGMLLARTRVGAQLDADQIILPSGDKLFSGAIRQVTAEYPYPLMAVHWMSRDPEVSDYPEWKFTAYSGYRSMRFGHAHILWTYHAQPFLGDYYNRVLTTNVSRMYTDEDLCNVMLWEKNLTKAFCKWDGHFLLQQLEEFLRGEPMSQMFDYSDSKWYPKGVPLLLWTWHDLKDHRIAQSALDMMEATMKVRGTNVTDLPSIQYKGKLYETEEQLFTDYPDCPCVM